ncbi:RagB/SusD family nutrient uptake outer membrane protein [Dyadobacter sp. CY323]|uniref:RagB/SusD family nutrient uptake outer membrane protein n=1 Tax=Dyadobacter sp. CY323 TaxID=2907302 RepID=UPI001F25D335|nr:RagB/SusD family nutrient uptake outer membrane protein [Dyadobacter sp. CY323]MCE6989770.1 RagB/SusD family nutrient uptake outer membrane protein [Dyadobacter sp. CY323]
MRTINHYIYSAFAVLLLGYGLVSCDNYLDVSPTDQVSDNNAWSTTGVADMFLNDIYGSLPGSFTTNDPDESFSDNTMRGSSSGYSFTAYAKSSYTPGSVRDDWTTNFAKIRKCNVFIEKVSASALPDAWKVTRIAETRFLRAYFYQLLWTRYGGVPIITEVLNREKQGDEIFRERSTSDETFKFITDECAAIAADLPLTPDKGRASKGAALTLKGWCELFQASPLKNPTNDKARWATAAATNKQVMDLNKYSLFPDLETLFYEENNNNVEVIFDKAYLGGTTLGASREGLHGAWMVGGTQRAWSAPNPTQEIVDSYFMANGLPITDPASGYDPQNPYLNREKRFYQSVIYDGSKWLGFEMEMWIGSGSRNMLDLSSANEATNTGYYLRKGLNPKYEFASGDQRLSSASFIIFRFAEVLLSYAEAKNEEVGPDASVYSAVNKVRERSGLPALKSGLTQAQMRVTIQQERRVELAFEEKRWPDLLRLKIAETTLNGAFHAMKIVKEAGKKVYSVIEAPNGGRIFFANRNYLLPIPQAVLDKNAKLKQNPNY